MEQQKNISPRGLGRGLASLIRPVSSVAATVQTEVVNSPGEGEGAKEGSGYRWLAIDQIQANHQQPRKRFAEAAIAELTASIREKGILSPLIVRRSGNSFELIAGERRWRAAKSAGLTRVPVVVRESSEGESLELALIENIQREDLNPLEEAAAYQALIDRFSYTQEQVAQKVGKDRASVANALRLLKLPEKVREALWLGRVTMGHARALLGVAEVERQLYYCDKIVGEGWSVRELERVLSAGRPLKARLVNRRDKMLPPALQSVLAEMRRFLGTQVRLVPSGKGGKILIEYYGPDDLNRLYHLMTKSNYGTL
ncbi:MAG: ParB/RepB/Spo0J family partition protein [Deltaproteobacteria bacterium]|nr:ParB/RepB/Spo0J family partition protein [Deltaproteobacteria bacterium]